MSNYSNRPRRAIRITVLPIALACALSFCVPLPVVAHPYTLEECFEGGDFIANAAKARDNGIAKRAFLERLVGDIHTIQAFPPKLRWFVMDPDDAEFLHAEAARVFDAVRSPEAHRAEFLARCFDRSERLN